MKKKLIFIIIGVILLAGASIGGLFYFKSLNKKSVGTTLSGYVLGDGMAPDLTPEEIAEMLQKEIDASKVVFSLYSEPRFKGKKGTIMFANPKHSAHNIDLRVKVDGKTVIRTEKIAPDQYIENIELIGKALKKGKHKGEAMITAYDKKTGKIVGEVAVEMNITSE